MASNLDDLVRWNVENFKGFGRLGRAQRTEPKGWLVVRRGGDAVVLAAG